MANINKKINHFSDDGNIPLNRDYVKNWIYENPLIKADLEKCIEISELKKNYKSICLLCNKTCYTTSKYRKGVCINCFINITDTKTKIFTNYKLSKYNFEARLRDFPLRRTYTSKCLICLKTCSLQTYFRKGVCSNCKNCITKFE